MKKNYFSKIAQASLEFIILFVFALVLVSLGLYFMGYFTLEFSRYEAQLYREDVANLVIEEFNIYSEMEGGYERNVSIPAYILRNYNISLNSSTSLMIIEDFVVEEGEIKHYYDLPLEVDFNTSINGDGDLIILLKKNNTQDMTNFLLI